MPVTLLQVHEGQVGPVDPEATPPPLPGGAAEVVRFFMEVPQWIQIGGVFVGGVAALVLVVFAWRRRQELWAGVAALPLWVKATGIAVVVAGGAVGGVAGYQVYDFVEHDNQFCTGCHLMAEAYMSFEESAHVDLGCKDCHAQAKTESMRQLYLWVVDRPGDVGPHSPVPDARCTSCHVDGDPEDWPQIAASLGHRVHFESDDPDLGELMCVTCHGISLHEFAPPATSCGECHEDETSVVLGGMAAETELHCVACHDFLGDRPATLPGLEEGFALMPDRAQCQSCHEMARLIEEEELDVDPHGAVCGACHNPHTQDTPSGAAESCVDCHEGADTLTVFHTGTHAPVLPDCTRCHTAHQWTVEGTECLSCHESIMDDPGSRQTGEVLGRRFLDPMRNGVDDGVREPNGSAIEAGPHDRSLPFLLMHGAGSLRSSRGSPPEPASGSADTIPRPFAHGQHEAVSCTECHGRQGEHGVITVQTPRDCAACHHDPGRGFECGDCHPGGDLAVPRQVSTTVTLTVWEEPRSRQLSFEHEYHESLQCQECHTSSVLLTAEPDCAACHDDHHRPEADCSSCHEPAESEAHGLEVHLTCTSSGCHAGTAGDRPALTRSMCLTCHQNQRDHEPGLDCQNCHMIPEPPPTRPASEDFAHSRSGAPS